MVPRNTGTNKNIFSRSSQAKHSFVSKCLELSFLTRTFASLFLLGKSNWFVTLPTRINFIFWNLLPCKQEWMVQKKDSGAFEIWSWSEELDFRVAPIPSATKSYLSQFPFLKKNVRLCARCRENGHPVDRAIIHGGERRTTKSCSPKFNSD